MEVMTSATYSGMATVATANLLTMDALMEAMNNATTASGMATASLLNMDGWMQAMNNATDMATGNNNNPGMSYVYNMFEDAKAAKIVFRISFRRRTRIGT